jgi:hypothetical protein
MEICGQTSWQMKISMKNLDKISSKHGPVFTEVEENGKPYFATFYQSTVFRLPFHVFLQYHPISSEKSR